MGKRMAVVGSLEEGKYVAFDELKFCTGYIGHSQCATIVHTGQAADLVVSYAILILSNAENDISCQSQTVV